MGTTPAWLEGLEVVTLDSDQLRALAHPTRNRIVSSLRIDGPATSSGLAQRLGTNSGQTSYHVRMLHDVGMVVEDPDRGTARERWWKAAHRGHSWNEVEFEGDPDDRAAADWLGRRSQRHYAQWGADWLDSRHEWPAAWRRAATMGDNFLMADPALLRELARDLNDLLEDYRVRGGQLDASDDDVHRVSVTYQAFPTDELRQ